MFQTVSLSIIRSLVLCVQHYTPDDGQGKCPKHAEFYSKNKFQKIVHLVGFIIRIYHDARSSECQMGWMVGGSNPCRFKKFFFSSKTIQTSSGAHPVSWWASDRGVKLIAHFQQVSRLRMSGAIPQLPLYTFTAWAGTTLPSYKVKGSHTT